MATGKDSGKYYNRADLYKTNRGIGELTNLHGAKFCFTGKLSSMTREEAGELVDSKGGVILPSVSGCDYLVLGEEKNGLQSTKHKTALVLKKKIISEAEFLDMISYNGNSNQTDVKLANQTKQDKVVEEGEVICINNTSFSPFQNGEIYKWKKYESGKTFVTNANKTWVEIDITKTKFLKPLNKENYLKYWQSKSDW